MSSWLKSVGIGSISILTLLSGCVVAPERQVVREESIAPVCGFPDAPAFAAPPWVCDASSVEGVKNSAIGTYRKTRAGFGFQRSQATAAARNALASSMKTKVGRLIKNYTETTGIGDDEAVDAVALDVSKQVTAEILYGTKIYKSTTNPGTGVVYVLVGMDSGNSALAIQDALKASYRNKKAMWQRFLGKRAHEELDAEIEKMSRQISEE